MTRQTRKTDIDAEIDANLKRAFDSLAQEPVPDRFTDLLNQLRTGDVQASSEKGERHDD
ncbi:NepR family anti-sigma factor [Tateyamaria sp. syn59]|uniref:NepR family anti-sigma factor n=1 Tax=Tateyamaria sp. syn59 TaxID=2576942 RepID=UPI0016756DEC|nr:NepR family anti-sigma factor [Tateyamaria sp. syn59]